MAPQNQSQPSFDPSRDIDAYMSDEGEALRRRGLQKQSIRLYELLCRLCPPGESQLVYRHQADLVSDLKRFAPDDEGITEGSVSRKLNRLASLGFAAKSGGGQSNCPLVVDLYLPDLVAPKPPRPRKPAVVVSPSDERQGQFFDGAAFRLVGADDEPPEAQSLAVSKAQAIALSVGKSASDCAFEPARQGDPTSYPRTRVRVPGVESSRLDESTETNSKEISQEELVEAQHAWLRTRARWRAKGVTHRILGKDGARNVQAFLKAAVLLGRGQLAEAVYAAAAEAPVLASKITDHPFAIVWTEWKRDKRFKAKIAQLQLPANWDEGLYQPPQRE